MKVLSVREFVPSQCREDGSEVARVLQPQILHFKPEGSQSESLKITASAKKDNSKEHGDNTKGLKEIVPAVLKVVAAGGGGANAVNRMIRAKMSGVDFIAINTDIQALEGKCLAETKIPIGASLTGGCGAGGNPEIGEKAALEDSRAIADVLSGAHMVFITGGMGGGTGTGSAPVIGKIAMEQGALTVAVVTTPFDFEADHRMKQAQEGVEKLRENVDAIIVIPNQHLFKIIDNKTPYDQAYEKVDEVLCRAVRGISELITGIGFINTDFADVKSILKGKGDALMGIGIGNGENRAMDAVIEAIDNPLLEDTSLDGATGVLINIAGPEDMTMVEISNMIKAIKEKCAANVNIIHGIRKDPELENSIQITVVATGFQNEKTKKEETAKKETVAAESLGSDVFDYNEYVTTGIDKTKKSDYFDYLPPRENQEQADLDVPPLIRNSTLFTEEKPVSGKFA